MALPDIHNQPIQEESAVPPRRKRRTRREFLVAAKNTAFVGLGLTAVGGAGLEIVAHVKKEVPPSARVLNGLQVLTELTKANINGKEDEIRDARKLVIVWLFAESSSLFGAQAGNEQAANMIEHYLYGNGKEYDLSALLSETVQQRPTLFAECLRESFISFCAKQQPSNFSMEKFTPEEFLVVFEKFRVEFARTGGTAVATLGGDGGTYLAVGNSTYTATADATAQHKPDGKYGDKSIEITMKHALLTMFDDYNWDRDVSAGIDSLAGQFASQISFQLRQAFMANANAADEVMGKIGFPEKYRQMVRDVFNDFRTRIDDAARAVPKAVEDKITWATGSSDVTISELDMNLLRKIGAHDFHIRGTAAYDGAIHFMTTTTMSPPESYY